MQSRNRSKRRFLIAGILVLVASLLVATFAYRIAATRISQASPIATSTPVTQAVSPTQIPTPSPGVTLSPTPTVSPTANPAKILGTDGIPPKFVPGLSWVRIDYPTCGGGPPGGTFKKKQKSPPDPGVHVPRITCPYPHLPRLRNT